jgi:hypothetical protein
MSVVTIETVKEVAPKVYEKIQELKSYLDNIKTVCENYGGFSNFGDIDFSKEYDESYLKDETFHFTVIRFLYAARLTSNYDMTISDAMIVSDALRTTVIKELNSDDESYDSDVYMSEKLGISLGAMPGNYKVEVNNSAIDTDVAKYVKEYVSNIEVDNFDTYKDLYDRVESVSIKLEDELFTSKGFVIIDSGFFIQYIISIIMNKDEDVTLDISGVREKSKGIYNDSINNSHEMLFRSNKGENVDTIELIKNMLSFKLGIDASDIDSINLDEEEEDDGEY